MTKDNSTIQATQSVEEAFDAIIRADLAYINHWAPPAFSGEDVEGAHQLRRSPAQTVRLDSFFSGYTAQEYKISRKRDALGCEATRSC